MGRSQPNAVRGAVARVVACLALAVPATTSTAVAQVRHAPAGERPAALDVPRTLVRRTSAEVRTPLVPARPKAVVSVEGTAAVGLRIRLRGDRSQGDNLRYHWVQTQGPTADLDDPAVATPRLIVPEGTTSLGFVLTVANDSGMDSAPLTVVVGDRTAAAPALKADAGDDQIGVIGRQITLNGIRSQPRGQVGYRWIQVAGPRVVLKLEDGYIFSFVPAEPGTYRFALVIASGSEISEPALVTVAVGAGPPSAPTAASLTAAEGAASPAALVTPPTPQLLADFVRDATRGIEGGPTVAPAMAEVFDALVERLPLYQAYTDVYSEMGRRLESMVPQSPAARQVWGQRLFVPVTGRLIEELRREGLDLASAEGQVRPFSPSQRERLGAVLQSISDGLRAAANPQ